MTTRKLRKRRPSKYDYSFSERAFGVPLGDDNGPTGIAAWVAGVAFYSIVAVAAAAIVAVWCAIRTPVTVTSFLRKGGVKRAWNKRPWA